MKAWLCEMKEAPGAATVVFALSRGAARNVALSGAAFPVSRGFPKIRVTRVPALDSHYFGREAMDWDSAEDRLLMVRHAGLFCPEPKRSDCRVCPARPDCRMWRTLKDLPGKW